MSDAGPWNKPVVVLVPGAWNTPGSYNLLLPFLENAGYLVRTVSLPSVGAEPPITSIQPDLEAIKDVIQQEADNSHDVLLVMHDYAGIPGGEAVKDLDKATRAGRGQRGGVVCLFYVASPLMSTGSCLADVFARTDQSWIHVSRDSKVAIPDHPKDVFCPEVEPELAQEYTASLKPHSYQTFFGKTTWEPFRTIPCFCLFARLDKVVSLELQRSYTTTTEIKFKSSTINAGHCPFLAQPEDMAKAIRRAAKESTYYSGVIARDYAVRASS